MPRDKKYYESKIKEIELQDAVKKAYSELKKHRESSKK